MTIGLDVLLAWLMFGVLVGALAAPVLRRSGHDALAEARHARHDPEDGP